MSDTPPAPPAGDPPAPPPAPPKAHPLAGQAIVMPAELGDDFPADFDPVKTWKELKDTRAEAAESRKAKKAAERAAEDARVAGMTEIEQVIEKAKAEGRSELAAELAGYKLRDAVDGKVSDAKLAATLLATKGIDPGDADAVTAALGELITEYPTLAKPEQDPAGGQQPPAAPWGQPAQGSQGPPPGSQPDINKALLEMGGFG